MGFLNFIKRTAKKIGGGIATGAKWLGEHAKPIIHKIANVVETAAPYAAAAASALGQPELAGPISLAGKFARNVEKATSSENIPAPNLKLQKFKPKK